MLETQFIIKNKKKLVEGLKKRNFKQFDIIDSIIELDILRKQTQKKRDDIAAEQNSLSKKIGDLFKNKEIEKGKELQKTVADLKNKSKEYTTELKDIQEKLSVALLEIPNMPNDLVPAGNSDEDNEIIKIRDEKIPKIDNDALPHWELSEKYNLFDLKLGVKITGSGFPLYRGKGAKLQRSLINFFLDEAVNAGYEEIIPPLLVNEASARATGQLPDKEGQMYHAETDDLYLIPTAEVPLTNIFRDVTIDANQCPIKVMGYTPCFRREAGSYGAHVRGLNRVHQFDKVEIVQIQHPDKSYEALDEMIKHIAGLLEKLELPYRILRLCGGDLGFTSAITYDFEVYSAAQKRWLEVSSVSNFETFQSNRLNLKLKDGKNRILAHTLNGSALALPRIMAALLENNQTASGIVIPDVLHNYTKFKIISK